MAADLLLPGEIIGCPTVRDRDGLALSSRNARLTADQRSIAFAVPRALFRMRDAVAGGEAGVGAVIAAGRAELEMPGIEIEYLAVVHPETLEPLEAVLPGARALVAVRLGEIRLIDNLELAPVSFDSATGPQ
jgi:pantoate--beta-alanine ligase